MFILEKKMFILLEEKETTEMEMNIRIHTYSNGDVCKCMFILEKKATKEMERNIHSLKAKR